MTHVHVIHENHPNNFLRDPAENFDCIKHELNLERYFKK